MPCTLLRAFPELTCSHDVSTDCHLNVSSNSAWQQLTSSLSFLLPRLPISSHQILSHIRPHRPCPGPHPFRLLLLSRFSRVRLCATHRRQPARLPRPWDSPGKNTGVGCHFLLQCMKVKGESKVAQLSVVAQWSAGRRTPCKPKIIHHSPNCVLTL